MFVSKRLVLILLTLAFSRTLLAQESPKVSIGYVKDGLKFNTSDGNFSTVIGLRFQLRFYTPFDNDPTSVAEYEDPSQPSFVIRRARFKIGGNYRSLRYKFEYDVIASRIYDLYFSYENNKKVQLRIGQYKALYNRERVISSGRGLLIERSITNNPFTVDRQIGMTVSGNLDGNSIANFSYYASVHTGMGSMATYNDDDKFMYIGRVQWNFLGQDIDIYDDGGDLKGNKNPIASIGFAALTNTSSFNRFDSGQGGVLLDGYTTSLPGEYRINQYLQDFVFKFKGISILQEYHYKIVDDLAQGSRREMASIFAQAGIFPGYFAQALPEKLQLVFRYAHLKPHLNVPQFQNEHTLGLNWYFNGFNNRLQADFSVIDMALADGTVSASRFRLQWDVTF